MSEVTRIIAAVVDQQQLTMYKADGETILIPQGDPRIRPLVDKLVPALEGVNKFCDLYAEDFQINTHYAEAEKKLGGVVRFFRVLKAKAKEILDKFVEPVEPLAIGSLPVSPVTVTLEEGIPEEIVAELSVEEKAPQTKSQAAVNEIMAHAVPAHSSAFHMEDRPGAENETTVVAVLADNTVIPGIEQMDVQLQALAANMGSAEGVGNFFNRVASVKRAHTVQDLLKFMQKGELPIADDGTVLVYKLLNRVEDTPGVFTDCHTNTVRQRVGSHVLMDEALVDPNRSQECSNGLHVARRDYLSGFGGNVCVLAKLAPEDVIAVPHRDASKLRAKGYHIIAELSQVDHDHVIKGRPLTDTALLGNAASGNHIGVIERVQIMDQRRRGDSVVITSLVPTTEAEPLVDNGRRAQSLDNLPAASIEEATVDARKIATDLASGRAEGMERTVYTDEGKPGGDHTATVTFQGDQVIAVEVAPATSLENPPFLPIVERALDEAKAVKQTPVQLLVTAFNQATTIDGKQFAAEQLVSYKKASKKSWSALGVPAVVYDDALNRTSPVRVSAVVEKFPVTTVKKTNTYKASKPKETAMQAPAVTKVPGQRTQQEEAAHLWALYQKNPDVMNARALVSFKQKAKKSWTVLGLTDEIGKRMVNRIK